MTKPGIESLSCGQLANTIDREIDRYIHCLLSQRIISKTTETCKKTFDNISAKLKFISDSSKQSIPKSER